MEEFPKPKRELSKEEEQDAQIGLLEWELEDRERQHGLDHLTGASTRKVFDDKLEDALKKVRGEIKGSRESDELLKEISLVFIDLDNFKQVNDTRGHVAGDEVLKKVAGLLRGALRETDMLARYGGDEFVVLLPNIKEHDALNIANKLRKTLNDDPALKSLGVTASFGVCTSDESAVIDPESFIKRADTAAYEAKKAGRNRVEVHTNGKH